MEFFVYGVDQEVTIFSRGPGERALRSFGADVYV